MKKVSFELQPIGYPVYHAMAQLNRSFEDCIGNLNHLMSFNLLDPDTLRTYEVMVEEVRALVNQCFGDFINGAELENATYFEKLRLKWQEQSLAETEQVSASRQKVKIEKKQLPEKTGKKGNRRGRAVQP